MGIRMEDKHSVITDAVYITPAPVMASLYSWWQSVGMHEILVDVALILAIIAALGRAIIIWRDVFTRKSASPPRGSGTQSAD